jgi:virginiamycin B lyase
MSQHGAGVIGKMTLDGAVTEYGSLAMPYGIAVGPDKAIWAAGAGPGTICCGIYRVWTDGTLTSYSLAPAYAKYVTAGPGGSVWFTTTTSIGAMGFAGTFVEYPLTSEFGTPTSITAGPDYQVYFTTTGQMGRISTAGAITPLGYPDHADVAFAPDQSMWLTQNDAATITHVAPNGDVHVFPANNATGSIAYGPDGNMWFTEPYSSRIGRITPSGDVTEFATQSVANDIAAGPDGNMWFCQTGFVGRITTQ